MLDRRSGLISSFMTWGAVPFVSLAFGAWLLPSNLLSPIYDLFLLYSLMIFSYMTGTLWGGHLIREHKEGKAREDVSENKVLSVAIAAFLVAFASGIIAYFYSDTLAVGLMLIAYLSLPYAERYSQLPFPTSYQELRTKINRTVWVSHLVVLVHMTQPHV